MNQAANECRYAPANGAFSAQAVLESDNRRPPETTMTRRFVRAQAVNTRRDAISLRPFRMDEFGNHPASPSAAHIEAANRLIISLRRPLLGAAAVVEREANAATAAPSGANLRAVLERRHMAHNRAKLVEQIWDYYLELFGQRQTRFAKMLLGLDRIALDCYQAVYTGLGQPRPLPTPAPFTYMETGFTPATFRRGIRLSRLGRNLNPFPIVKLPYHRVINPWTLGAVHHEVSHNIQSDLGLWEEVPRWIVQRLVREGLPAQLAAIWGRWHKEIWADLCAALLGGPGIVASLIDVLARSRASTLRFNAAGVHPTPFLRTLISTELLRRMGFGQEARGFEQLWRRLYPSPERSNIPPALLQSFRQANRLVVDTICYQRYPQLGSKSLAEVFSYNRNHQAMTYEAAQRMARGVDPGIIPARFLVAAARDALDAQLAAPSQIARNFYQALDKR
jgi:hypothetical protein